MQDVPGRMRVFGEELAFRVLVDSGRHTRCALSITKHGPMELATRADDVVGMEATEAC